MSTAVIVVSLPGLKSFIIRSRTPDNTKNYSSNGFARDDPYQSFRNEGSLSRPVASGAVDDDGMELVEDTFSLSHTF